MKKLTILLADDDPDFLALRAEYLEAAGYRVLTASNPDAAKTLLENAYVHLALLDLRLDTGDDMDKSGLMLAKSTARSVVKVMITAYPSVPDAVNALRPDHHELPPAVDFFTKKDAELDKLPQIIENAITKHMQINWELEIMWSVPLSSPQLATLIEPNLITHILLERAVELEDLFRKLFHTSEQITIDELLVHTGDRVLLKIYAFKTGSPARQFIVSCGQSKFVKEEARRYQEVVPNLSQATILNHELNVETTHYSASAYQLVGGDLEETISLKAFFQRRAPAETAEVVRVSLEENLPGWYRCGRYYQSPQTLLEFYQTRQPAAADKSFMQNQVSALCDAMLTAGIGQCTYHPSHLSIRMADGQSVVYPNPMNTLSNRAFALLDQVQWGIVHGRVTTETILVGKDQQTWLIDFSQVGPAPLLHDFVTLETSIKLSLLPPTLDLALRHQFERTLVQSAWLHMDLTGNNVSAEQDAVLLLVSKVRQAAANLLGCNLHTYQIGLFSLALSELAQYDQSRHRTKRSLGPFAHVLISAAMLHQSLTSMRVEVGMLPAQAQQGLWIDEDKYVVWVEGRQVDVTVQEFQILYYLYKRAGQLCLRQAIIEEGLGDLYDEHFRQDESRLNSAMSRLRAKVEPNPGHVKYLETVRGKGYRLLLPLH